MNQEIDQILTRIVEIEFAMKLLDPSYKTILEEYDEQLAETTVVNRESKTGRI